jgi:two-component system, cell cycle response regulator
MNVLLINYSQSFHSAVLNSLKKLKAKIIVSEGVDNVLAEIQKYNINIAMINWSMGDFDVKDLCKKIRKFKHTKYIYILLVISRDREDSISGILEAGANDFVFKPFGKHELASRINIADRMIRLEEEIIRNKKRIMKLVKEDPITGLYNRRSLLDEALKEMGRAAREMKYISALMADISNFNEIAAKYGMTVMDELLHECGRRLKTSCRPYDKIGRYTISDFLVFLPDSGKSNAELVAKRIISSIAKKPFYIKGNKISFTLTVGISELDPGDISKNNSVDSNLLNDIILDTLIKKSDTAVKKALKTGGNRVEIYTG